MDCNGPPALSVPTGGSGAEQEDQARPTGTQTQARAVGLRRPHLGQGACSKVLAFAPPPPPPRVVVRCAGRGVVGGGRPQLQNKKSQAHDACKCKLTKICVRGMGGAPGRACKDNTRYFWNHGVWLIHFVVVSEDQVFALIWGLGWYFGGSCHLLSGRSGVQVIIC